MLTYTPTDLLSMRHCRPPERAVRKAIFSAHLWQPVRARQSADRLFVNTTSAERERRLRIGWLNVRSLANKTVAVHEAIVAKNLDILSLTEMWHHDTGDISLRQAAPPDFAVVDAVRESQPGYGGIAVLYSSLMRCRKLDLPPTTTFEALATRFEVSGSAWLLLTIYRPGSCQPSSVFHDELSTVFETLVTHGCPVIIGDDINVHVENPLDLDACCLMELLSSMDLQQHVTLPTHQAGGTLDLVITFSDFDVDDLNVDPPGVMSDHSLITCSVPVRRLAPPPFTRCVRSWRAVDRAALCHEIANSPLGRVPPSSTTAAELFQAYHCTLRRLADQFAPERTVKCRLRPLCPWFDAECRSVRRDCRRQERLYRRTRDSTSKAAYLAACQKKHEVLDQKKTQYWSERIQNEGSSPTRLWQSMSTLLQRDRRTAEVATPTNHDADAFLRYFDEKVKTVRSCNDQRTTSACIHSGNR